MKRGFIILALAFLAFVLVVSWLAPESLAFISVISGFVVVVLSRFDDAQRERERLLRDKRCAVYEKVLTHHHTSLYELIHAKRMAEDNKLDIQDAMSKAMEKVNEDYAKNIAPSIIMWASQEIIQEYSNYKEIAIKGKRSGDTDNLFLIDALEDLMMNMRRDVGHKDKKLKRDDLTSIYTPEIRVHRKHFEDSLSQRSDIA